MFRQDSASTTLKEVLLPPCIRLLQCVFVGHGFVVYVVVSLVGLGLQKVHDYIVSPAKTCLSLFQKFACMPSH